MTLFIIMVMLSFAVKSAQKILSGEEYRTISAFATSLTATGETVESFDPIITQKVKQ